ncbi:MAG: hypothetical protein HC809_09005 [Gammaproteobacteria bacterium]|nr:hypothetical protein [Gammaproteobacteria bacterium]
MVINKIDSVVDRAPGVERDAEGVPQRVFMSAATGAGAAALIDAIAERIGGSLQSASVVLPANSGKTRAWLYKLGAVQEEAVSEDGHIVLAVKLSADGLARLAALPGISLQGVQGAPRIPASPSH